MYKQRYMALEANSARSLSPSSLLLLSPFILFIFLFFISLLGSSLHARLHRFVNGRARASPSDGGKGPPRPGRTAHGCSESASQHPATLRAHRARAILEWNSEARVGAVVMLMSSSPMPASHRSPIALEQPFTFYTPTILLFTSRSLCSEMCRSDRRYRCRFGHSLTGDNDTRTIENVKKIY